MVHTLSDISGDNLNHNLGAAAAAVSGLPLQARWIQFIVSGSGTARIGDSTVTSSRGLPIAAVGGQLFPWTGDNYFYALGAITAYVPSGATLSVAYEF